MIPDPGQPSPGFYVPTRRAQSLRTRADVDAYRKDRILPDDLLPPLFAEKVLPLFRRGDYDVAVLQVLKEIEVAVRKAVKTKGAGYADSEIGTTLMRKAFHPDTGPLSDKGKLPAEREAEMHISFLVLSVTPKIPRVIGTLPLRLKKQHTLIIFASYLFGIVEQRTK